MKIAVIGSGLAGLHVSWLLSCAEHFDPHEDNIPQVHLIERAPSLGMDAASVNVLNGKARVDVPMRAFFPGYYPKLVRLYRWLNIATERRNHSLAWFTVFGNKNTAAAQESFIYGDLKDSTRWSMRPWSLFNDVTMGYNWLRFLYNCHKVAANPSRYQASLSNKTIEEYLVENGYNRSFIDDNFYALNCSVCTCSVEAIKNYQAFVLLEYWGSGMMFEGTTVVSMGVQEVCKRLASRIHKVSLDSLVTEIRTVTLADKTKKVMVTIDGQPAEAFDHVILASQANQALRMLADPSDEETDTLSAFEYVRSTITVHTDTSLMPKDKSLWRSLNFIAFHDQNGQLSSIMHHTWMNVVLPELKNDEPIFTTWNPHVQPASHTVISENSFERPLVTVDTPKHLQKLWKLQGQQHRWFIGAFAFDGVPLLEGCIESGLRVAKHFGVKEERVFKTTDQVTTTSPSNKSTSFFEQFWPTKMALYLLRFLFA